MKNISRNVLILALILMALSIGIPAFAADSGKSNAAPGSALDEWDDDVWSDWGAQPVTKGGAPDPGGKDGELPSDPYTNGAGATPPVGTPSFGGGGSSGGSFGDPNGKFRFNLVRDGIAELKGVRKYRPAYRRKTL